MNNVGMTIDWQFWGVVATVLFGLFSVYVFRRSQQKKELTYELVTVVPLITDSVHKQIENKLKILSGNTEVLGSVYLIVLQFTNTGNKGIVKDDYKQPLSIHFGDECKVLDVAVKQSSPASLITNLQHKEKHIELSPELLNPRDGFEIQVLVNKFGNKVSHKGHILETVIRERDKDRANLVTQLSSLILSNQNAAQLFALLALMPFFLLFIFITSSEGSNFDVIRYNDRLILAFGPGFANDRDSVKGMYIGSIQEDGNINYYALQEFANFSNLNFSELPNDVCLQFVSTSEMNENAELPDACTGMVVTEFLDEENVFWRKGNIETDLVFSSSTTTDISDNPYCNGQAQVCEVRYSISRISQFLND